MKRCRYCAETIQSEAIYCRFCGKRVVRNYLLIAFKIALVLTVISVILVHRQEIRYFTSEVKHNMRMAQSFIKDIVDSVVALKSYQQNMAEMSAATREMLGKAEE